METFVVRVWVPAGGEAEGRPAGLHGVVEHLASQRSRPFRGDADLAAFMHACLGDRAAGTPDGMAPDGMAPDGMAPDGMAPDGMAPDAETREGSTGPRTAARDAPSVWGIPGAGLDDSTSLP